MWGEAVDLAVCYAISDRELAEWCLRLGCGRCSEGGEGEGGGDERSARGSHLEWKIGRLRGRGESGWLAAGLESETVRSGGA